MLIVYDTNNNVVGSFVDGSTAISLPGVTNLPTPQQQVGKNPALVFDPTSQVLSYNYVDRPLTVQEQLTVMQDGINAALGV
jgi:hypothetical protein